MNFDLYLKIMLTYNINSVNVYQYKFLILKLINIYVKNTIYSDEILYQIFCSNRPVTLICDDYNRLVDVSIRDICENLIKLSEYGNTNSKFGWEIDHAIPKSFLKEYEKKKIYEKLRKYIESDDNLQPLYWNLNREKDDRIFDVQEDYYTRKIKELDKRILSSFQKIKIFKRTDILKGNQNN
jgi:hypothetical protein